MFRQMDDVLGDLPLHSGDVRERYLDRPRNFLNNGQVGHGILSNQADALFFVAEVHESGGRPAGSP